MELSLSSVTGSLPFYAWILQNTLNYFRLQTSLSQKAGWFLFPSLCKINLTADLSLSLTIPKYLLECMIKMPPEAVFLDEHVEVVPMVFLQLATNTFRLSLFFLFL